MERINLQINGMTCGHCVASVKRALAQVGGASVESVNVGSAQVAYDPAATSPAGLGEAVRDAGYEVVGANPRGP